MHDAWGPLENINAVGMNGSGGSNATASTLEVFWGLGFTLGLIVPALAFSHILFERWGYYRWEKVDKDHTALARSSIDRPKLLLAVRALFFLFSTAVVIVSAVSR
jgi:hypothetical protein